MAVVVLPAPPAAPAIAAPPAERSPFDAATGYRIDHYRGPIPSPPAGVARIEAAEAHALFGKGTPMIDVLPLRPGGWDPATGAWLLTEPHQGIAGARWYPEAGRGRLDPVIAAWFRRAVEAATHGDHAAPLVVYCLADCWMSWNAARRLREWGFTVVKWFATGVDGWREAGFPLAPVTPEPVR